MPVVSRVQAGFMGASRTPAGRRRLRAHGKTPASISVANDFLRASKGMKFEELPYRKQKGK